MKCGPNGHYAEPIVKLSFGKNRPPVVKENLERPPQGDPATNHHTFAEQRTERGVTDRAIDKTCRGDRRCEKSDADDQARPSNPEKLTQTTTRAH